MTEELTRAAKVIEEIEPLLCGHGPDVQGAVLMYLTATWLSGFYPPEMRRDMFKMHTGQLHEAMEAGIRKARKL